jgi:hypothetical protein
MKIYDIQVHDELLRRIPRKPSHLRDDGKPTSVAFKTKKNEDGLSINILCLTTLEFSIPNISTHTGGVIIAELPMSLGYQCKHHPLDMNYSHGLIVGDTNPIARKLAENCKMIE